MKKFLLSAVVLIALFAMSAAACGIDTTTTLKDLTDPYIARYECTYATFGGEDILKDYDFIRITILDKKDMEFSYKRTGGKAHARKFGYTYDETNGGLLAEESILGVRLKERVIIKDASFTVNFPIGSRELVMKFKEI